MSKTSDPKIMESKIPRNEDVLYIDPKLAIASTLKQLDSNSKS